jgi:hypothetical protein
MTTIEREQAIAIHRSTGVRNAMPWATAKFAHPLFHQCIIAYCKFNSEEALQMLV